MIRNLSNITKLGPRWLAGVVIGVALVLAGCGAAGGAPKATPTPSKVTAAQLVGVAKQVYFSRDGKLGNCAVSAKGSFSGYGGCPFTSGLVAKYKSFSKKNVLTCGAKLGKTGVPLYTATVVGDGGSVGVAVAEGATNEVYILKLNWVGSKLKVKDIQEQASATSAAVELTVGC